MPPIILCGSTGGGKSAICRAVVRELSSVAVTFDCIGFSTGKYFLQSLFISIFKAFPSKKEVTLKTSFAKISNVDQFCQRFGQLIADHEDALNLSQPFICVALALLNLHALDLVDPTLSNRLLSLSEVYSSFIVQHVLYFLLALIVSGIVC